MQENQDIPLRNRSTLHQGIFFLKIEYAENVTVAVRQYTPRAIVRHGDDVLIDRNHPHAAELMEIARDLVDNIVLLDADGDKGFKYSVTRHWDDFALGFWYIDTDIHTYDKDFTRAGVHMELPAEKWFGSLFGNSSAHIWEQNTMLQSSWNSESGRDAGIIRTPERMMSQLRPSALKRNVEQLLCDYCSYDDDTVKEDAREIRSILEYITR